MLICKSEWMQPSFEAIQMSVEVNHSQNQVFARNEFLKYRLDKTDALEILL